MSERKEAVTMKGNPLTLIGDEMKTGVKAPDFTVVDNNLGEFNFYKNLGKVYIISAVPSLDTGVCDKETRTFNEKASELGEDIEILTVSMDLPFAQTRWCGASGVDKVKTLSDHKEASFGMAYGVLIKELRLLARCVFVIDKEGIIRHIELVKEIVDEPNYDNILKEAQKLV